MSTGPGEDYNIAVAFQARVTPTGGSAAGVGPVQISYAERQNSARGATQVQDYSAVKQVRLQLNAGDSVGVQVAAYAPANQAYVDAPAGLSTLTLKRIV